MLFTACAKTAAPEAAAPRSRGSSTRGRSSRLRQRKQPLPPLRFARSPTPVVLTTNPSTPWLGPGMEKAQPMISASKSNTWNPSKQSDYEVNINAFIEEGCDLIISVGFLLPDATAAAADRQPRPEIRHPSITATWIMPNVRGNSTARSIRVLSWPVIWPPV